MLFGPSGLAVINENSSPKHLAYEMEALLVHRTKRTFAFPNTCADTKLLHPGLTSRTYSEHLFKGASPFQDMFRICLQQCKKLGSARVLVLVLDAREVFKGVGKQAGANNPLPAAGLSSSVSYHYLWSVKSHL